MSDSNENSLMPVTGKILIVDDNPSNLSLLQSMLTRRKFKVETARSGKEALVLLDTFKPDLILLDVLMPEMDGFTTCSKIKEKPEHADLPVIFLSAVYNTEDKVRGFNTGGVDYITKPFQKEELLARVNTHLTLRKHKRELSILNKNLQDLVLRKDRLFSIISHDIKSPLTTILGYSEIIAEDYDMLTREEVVNYAENINQVTKSAVELMNNLLAWSQLQLNRVDYSPSKLNIQEEINKNINLFTQAALLKNITIEVKLDETDLVYADVRMINTVLRNLISNAIKFTLPGGNINISAIEDGEGVNVSVEDDGIGMDDSLIDALFEIGNKKTRPGTENEKGTGIGLMLCKEFITMHNSEIHVFSEPNHGSKFSFTLHTKKEN